MRQLSPLDDNPKVLAEIVARDPATPFARFHSLQKQFYTAKPHLRGAIKREMNIEWIRGIAAMRRMK